jgi:stage V sporulation protein B
VIFLRAKRSILQNTLLLTLVHLFLRCVSLLFEAVLARRLGAGGMGLLQLLLTAGSFAMTLGMAGVRASSAYLCAEETGRGNPAGVFGTVRLCARYGFCLSCAAGLALWLLSPLLAGSWIHEPDAVPALRLLAVFLPAGCLCEVFSGYCTASSHIRRLAALEIAEQLLSLLLTLALLFFWAGGDALRCCCAVVLGGGLAEILSDGILYLLFRRDFSGVRSAGLRGMFRRLLRLCLPLGLSECLRAGLGALEQFLFPWGLVLSGISREAALGEYGLLRGMVFPLLMFPASVLFSLSELLAPELARCGASKNKTRVRELADTCLRVGFVYTAAAAALLYLLAEPLGLLLYQNADVGRWLRLFAPTALFLYMDALVDAMNKGLGRQAACARINLLTSGLDAALLALLLPKYGAAGYYFCFLAAHLLNFALSLRVLLRCVRVPLRFRSAFRAVFCALLAAGACVCFPAPQKPLAQTLLYAAVFLTVLIPMLALTRALRPTDRLRLRRAVPALDFLAK